MRQGRFAARSRGRIGRVLVGLVLAAVCGADALLAAEPNAGPRSETGFVGAVLGFFASYPFVLLFATLAAGTALGRAKLGFLTLGSTAGTLLVGTSISLWAYLGFGIRYAVPGLVTTIFLNLFMFAVGLKVGPQFLAGLRRDGVKGVTIALIVVTLNFGLALGGARLFDLSPGFASGLIAGSMTDTAVIGVANSTIEGGIYVPPAGMAGEDVSGNVAAAYAITYLVSLVGMILLIRYLPLALRFDAAAAARAAEAEYGADGGHLPAAGSEAAYLLERVATDVRAFRVEAPGLEGLALRELSARVDLPILMVRRDSVALDLAMNPALRRGDVVTLIGDVERLLERGREIGAEVADAEARDVKVEIADLVVTRPEFVGRTLAQGAEVVRRALAAGGSPAARLFHPVGLLRAGAAVPTWPDLPLASGDVVRVIGRPRDTEAAGRVVGATLHASKESDVLTLAVGLAAGFVVGTFHLTIGGIPFGLGAPAGVMLAGIAISILRARFPLLGGSVSEGARSLLQSLGLDVFIAVTALNAAAGVAGAFTGGYVGRLLAIGLVAGLLPPLVAWWFGRRVLRMNGAILLGTLCGARHSTPGLRIAQEVTGSAVPAVGYPVAYAISSVAVLVLGYLALFL